MWFARASTASACCVHACSQDFFFNVVTGRGVMMTGARDMDSRKVDDAQPPWQGHPQKQGSKQYSAAKYELSACACAGFLPTGFW